MPGWAPRVSKVPPCWTFFQNQHPHHAISERHKSSLIDTFLPSKLRQRHHKSTPMITKHTQPCLVIGGPFGQATMALCNGFLVNLVSELCGGLLVLEQENEGFLLMVPLNTCSDCLETNRNVLESHPEASTINRIRLLYMARAHLRAHTWLNTYLSCDVQLKISISFWFVN